MRVLAIETSCDESALALLESDGEGRLSVLFESLFSQERVHNAFGGVVPEIASREHLEALPSLMQKFFDAGFHLKDTDVIAATCGPGLKGCLLVGMSFAAGLARSSGKLLRAAHHIEGHLLSGFLGQKQGLSFPYLGVIVSGGHTEFVVAHDVGRYEVMARTHDDAAGEAFDKSAKLLGLPYPGGRFLSELALLGQDSKVVFPTAMSGSLELSFSGIKTAIARVVQRSKEEEYPSIAYAAEQAIVVTIVDKLEIALERCGLRQVVLCGGVAANRVLRDRIQSLPGIELFVPDPQHCTDNAAMIAGAVLMREQAGVSYGEKNFAVRSRWPLEEANCE